VFSSRQSNAIAAASASTVAHCPERYAGVAGLVESADDGDRLHRRVVVD